MPTLLISGQGASSGSAARTGTRLAVRGRRRQAIRNLLRNIDVVSRQDQAEDMRAAEVGYTPLLVSVRSGNPVHAGMLRLRQRLVDLLALKQ